MVHVEWKVDGHFPGKLVGGPAIQKLERLILYRFSEMGGIACEGDKERAEKGRGNGIPADHRQADPDRGRGQAFQVRNDEREHIH